MTDFHRPVNAAALRHLRDLSLLMTRAGRAVALAGVVLPLLLIGHSKFGPVQVVALEQLASGTPWLAWMHPTFGDIGTARLLGGLEIATALLLCASPWAPRAGVVGGALASLTFLVTTSMLLPLPIWEAEGPTVLNSLGGFLIKDVSLLGVSLVLFAESLDRATRRSPHPAPASPSASTFSLH